MATDDEGPRLPVLSGIFARAESSSPPTLDDARVNLGGAWEGALEVGRVVELSGRRFGVVIHGAGESRDVYVGQGRIVRLPTDQLRDFDAPDADLDAVASDARVYAGLREGQDVAYVARDRSVGEGQLLEKLRYGALVRTADGRALAISFRRLAPGASSESRA